MKKLLTLLAALVFSVSTAASVVACGANSSQVARFGTAVLPSDIGNEILMKLKDDDSFSPETKAKFFQQIDVDKIVKMMVQDNMAPLSQQYFQDDLKSRLGLMTSDSSTTLATDSSNAYAADIKQINGDIAQNQFYNRYTQNLAVGGAPLDAQIKLGVGDDTNLYVLNPYDLLKTAKVVDENDYYVFYQPTSGSTTWNRWQYYGEYKQAPIAQIPTINQLQTSQFVIVKKNDTINEKTNTIEIKDGDLTTKTNLFYIDADGNPVANGLYYSTNGDSALIMNGKTGLEYRFQEYFKTQITNNFYENVLTMTYLESNLYNVGYTSANALTKEDAYLNISSDLATNTQSWNQSDGYKSNLKLVWAFNKKDKTDLDFTTAYNQIDQSLVLNGDGSFSNDDTTSFRQVIKLLTDKSSLGDNDSSLGSDPFFNMAGYNGIVKNDGESIASADGTLNVADDAKAKIAQANRPTIISKNSGGQPFTGKNNSREIYFVMPIYLVDLLNDKTNGTLTTGTSNYDYGQTTTAFYDNKNFYFSYADWLASGGDASKQFSTSKSAVFSEPSYQALVNESSYYLYVNGAAYTIDDFNNKFNPKIKIDTKNIWDNTPPEVNGYEGFQFTLKNTLPAVAGQAKTQADDDDLANIYPIYGNIGVGQKDVYLGPLDIEPIDAKGRVTFHQKGGIWYADTTKLTSDTYGEILTCGSIKLSFDSGARPGSITYTGIADKTVGAEMQGHTLGYQINMGANSAQPNSYIQNGDFNYYDSNIASLDIINLSTDQKQSLLHQLEFIASKDADVSNSALAIVYPLFIESEQVLYKPLYESIRKYIDDTGGGTSD